MEFPNGRIHVVFGPLPNHLLPNFLKVVSTNCACKYHPKAFIIDDSGKLLKQKVLPKGNAVFVFRLRFSSNRANDLRLRPLAPSLTSRPKSTHPNSGFPVQLELQHQFQFVPRILANPATIWVAIHVAELDRAQVSVSKKKSFEKELQFMPRILANKATCYWPTFCRQVWA